ncbi:MAG: hypothetical protein HC817_11345 [Saprospiraceae bacterium]|nr:hypothetical protein [Saprospiraceae bacterium]
MNQLGSMYFTKEAYDKLYPGYGSSYINFYGGAGFLFEQASSRGHVQETTTIPLTFAFTIRNQFVAALTTVRASLAEKENLINLRHEFYKSASAQAKANPVKAYVFGDANDLARTYTFVNFLQMHHIECFNVENTIPQNGKNYEKGRAFIVPTEQMNYIMVRSIFEKGITYTDSIFYDASTWSIIHAFNLPYAELKTMPNKGAQITKPLEKSTPSVSKSSYAYIIELTDYFSHKALYELQKGGVIVQTSFKPFSLNIEGKIKHSATARSSYPLVYSECLPRTSTNWSKKIAQELKFRFLASKMATLLRG